MGKQIDFNSRIKDMYKNPIGHDVIYRVLLQLNKSEKILTNPFVGNLKLKTAAKLTNKILGKDFFETLINLLNTEGVTTKNDSKIILEKWWKEAVFYQIYPRSFNKGNLNGIIEKLDYIKKLGVNAIWLSPIYDSPNDDNGYDIRDYFKIQKEFGDMEDFEKLLEKAHEMDIKIIMDLVVNHTSDEHEWFKKALKDPKSKYRDYYFFRDKPNNWTSFFSGSAWNYYEEQDKWALHLFSKKQMDLNWDNEELRLDVVEMIKWWLKKGIDGFRLDVINYISKSPGLPDGNVNIGKLMGYYGIEHYFYGPRLHEYLHQIKTQAFEPFEAFSVGEAPGVGMEMGKLITADYRRELDMIFSFEHLEMPGHARFDIYKYDLNYMKRYYTYWMENYENSCWMSLFYENHDSPRMVSKIDKRPEYREVLAKLLAVIEFTLKGTPFIYQGQEIGSVNYDFKSIEEISDIESKNLYNELIKTMDEKMAFERILAGTREHARLPLNWDNMKDSNVLDFYKKLILIRKHGKTLIYGDIQITNKKTKDIFTYYRKDETNTYYIECNISSKFKKKPKNQGNFNLVISNYEKADKKLRPYEANIYCR